MRAKLSSVLVVLVILSAAPLFLSQGRRPQRFPQRRGARVPAPETTAPAATSDSAASVDSATPPADRGAEGAGIATPPKQGYVPSPEPPRPGTYVGFGIPSDPLDRGFWELYDGGKSITLTGKVTKVDWVNPNSYIYLAAGGGLWAIESGFIQFRQSSVTPAVKEEQVITVLGYLPKDDPGNELPARKIPAIAAYLKTNHLVRAGEITTAFGQKLIMGRPPSEAEMAERLKCSAFGC